MTTPLKKCTKCGEEKPATKEFFTTHPKGLYGLCSRCRACCNNTPDKKECMSCGKIFQPKYHKARVCSKPCGKRLYYINNKESILAYLSKRYQDDPDKVKKYQADRYRKNAVRIKEATKMWAKNNKDKIRVYRQKNKARYVSQLTDSYVIGILHRHSRATITPEIVSLKRKKIQAYRKVKQLKQKVKLWLQ